jgi:Domain of unknown function (DUF1906)
MRLLRAFFVVLAFCGAAVAQQSTSSSSNVRHLGFDRNEYPGDAALVVLRRHFSFVGYWLTNPPDATSNNWLGKRDILVKNDFGFLVLANGRQDARIKATLRATHASPISQGQGDGVAAVSAAKREHFPAGTIIFLDQEDGGRLTDGQLEYIRGWVQAVADGGYRAGAYCSGQPVDDGPGVTITTAQDIRARVDSGLKTKVVLWVYQDACPPSNGCTLRPPPLSASGTPDAEVWQYAQSPRKKENTRACAKTYAADGNCYVPDLPGIHLDLNLAASSDPSHGR